MHAGHRRRMLEKLKTAAGSLGDHELLEILLYNALPRRNTNELAHRLLLAFGSVSGVFQATLEQLAEVEGIGDSTAAYLRVIATFYEEVKYANEKAPSAYSAKEFVKYLSGRFRGLDEEIVELFAVDGKGNVRYAKRYTSGLSNKAEISMREVNSFLGKGDPHALVVAHNHPMGSAQPSAADDNFTKQVQTLCSMSNVILYDHIIVSENDFFSYYGSGRMDEIRDRYNPEALFGGKV